MIGYSERTSPMDVLYSKTGSFIDLRTISIEWLVFRELRSFQFSKFRSINYIRGRAFWVFSQRKVDIERFGIAGWRFLLRVKLKNLPAVCYQLAILQLLDAG